MGNFLFRDDTVNLDISNRGVRLEVLQDICRKIEEGLLSIPKDGRDRSPGEKIVHGYVKPVTLERRCSYAEYLYADPNTRRLVGKIDTFISHPWSASFFDTVAAIEEYEKKLPKDSPPKFYFNDYFAINQHSPMDDLPQLAALVRESDTMVLMAMPWRNPVVLTRLWCIFEIAHAVLGGTKIKIILPPEEEQDFQKVLREEINKSMWVFISKIFEKINSEKAQASVEKDAQQIRAFIKDELGGFLKVDTIAADGLRTWHLDAVLELLENFDEAKKGSLEHAELLAQAGEFHSGQSFHLEAARLYGEAAAIGFKKKDVKKGLMWEKSQLFLLRKAGKVMESLPKIIENVELHVNEFGPTARETLIAKRTLGATYRDLGLNTAAVNTLRTVVDEFKKDEKNNLRQIKLTKYQFGWALRNAGKYDEAMQEYQYVIDANTALLGRNDPNVLVCVSNYGRCLALAGKPELAIPLYEEAIPVMRMKWGPKDHMVIAGNKWLEEARSQLQEFSEAQSKQEEEKD